MDSEDLREVTRLLDKIRMAFSNCESVYIDEGEVQVLARIIIALESEITKKLLT